MKKSRVILILFFFVFSGSFSLAEEIQLQQPEVLAVSEKISETEKAVPLQIPLIPFKEMGTLEAQISTEIPTLTRLTLPEAINFALKNNSNMKKNRLDVDKAQNDIKAAGRFQNPYFQLFTNGGKAATDNPSNAGLIQPFEIAKRGPRKKLAKSNFELTKGNVALAEFRLRLEVRQTYVELVAAKSVLKILEGQKKLLEDLLEIAQKKYEVGAAPEMDVIQAKMTLDQLITQVNTARNNINVSRYHFNKILGTTGYDTAEDYLPEEKDFIFLLTPKPQDKMPEFNKVSQLAFEKRLDLKNAKQEVDIAHKNLTLIIRQRIPDIEIGGGTIFVPSSLSTSNSNTLGYYVASNITNIPLLYQYTPEIKNAKINVEQKELNYNYLCHEAIMDLHSTYDEFETAQTNLNYYNDALLDESKRFLRMSKRSYEIGKINITDFIFIEQSYKTILMGYTNALAIYYSSWVDFLREVNDEELKLDEK